MIDEKIHVAIRSYKRAGRVKTVEVAPFAWIWVPESQGAEYRRSYERVITIPDESDGNLSRKMNTILDRTPCEWTLILDDDISRIGYWEEGTRHRLSPGGFREFIVHAFGIAEGFGVKFWGINQANDPMFYDTYEPFNLLAAVLGPITGHLAPILRYDESVLGKDDYDFWLQNIHHYHKALRFNKYHYLHDHGKEPGGFVSMRTLEVEKRGIQRMQEKWGRAFRPYGAKGGKSATGKNILNSRVHVPIPGI